jgi:hypothetical protein
MNSYVKDLRFTNDVCTLKSYNHTGKHCTKQTCIVTYSYCLTQFQLTFRKAGYFSIFS